MLDPIKVMWANWNFIVLCYKLAGNPTDGSELLEKQSKKLLEHAQYLIGELYRRIDEYQLFPQTTPIEETKPTNKNMDLQEALNACYVDSYEPNCVKLPVVQLDRKVYLQLAQKLEAIGGKWNKKTKRFEFNESAAELLESIKNGAKINLKKEFQFFATPAEVADYLVELALESRSEGLGWVLEPSAGHGAIIDAILRVDADATITALEAMRANYNVLERKYENLSNVLFYEEDFLKFNNSNIDTIIANPPFAKNQDIEHVNHMFQCLESGGRLVSIMSTHWVDSKNKLETAFREFLIANKAEVYDLPAGTFKESGTNVAAKIVVIDKK